MKFYCRNCGALIPDDDFWAWLSPQAGVPNFWVPNCSSACGRESYNRAAKFNYRHSLSYLNPSGV